MTQRPRRRNRTAQAKLEVPPVTAIAGGGIASIGRPASFAQAGKRHLATVDHNGTEAALQVRSETKAGPLGISLSVEAALYILLIAAAALTRFWDLGKRALHHDESLHAYYSWVLAQGNGYRHDPLMHGPFLFETNALVYLLFGDSDATSRILPALAGVLIVASPWLLRAPDLLGKVGALTASLLFLISPTFLYYTRYIRHDPYTALGSILLFACIVRYRQRPERRWLIGGAVTLAVLFANHEIVFALVAIFAGFIWGALLWGRLRPLLPVQIAAAALLGATVFALPRIVDKPLPDIPWDEPTGEMERQYYVDLISHPVAIAVLVILIAFAAACAWVIRGERRRFGGMSVLDGSDPGSTEAAIQAARRDSFGLSIALIAFLVLSAAMFTTFFTNLYGLASGTIATDGTLLYWLGQQDEQRGDQPWFFYLLLAPQYEYLAMIFGVFGAAVAAVHTIRAVRGNGPPPARLFVRLFLAVWLMLIFAGLSYAGEKMPWLLLHITVPAVLLGGIVVDDAVNRWRVLRRQPAVRFGWPVPPWATALVVVGLGTCAGAWFFLAARLTYGDFERVDDGPLQRVTSSNALDRWWLLALPPLAGVLVLLSSVFWRGFRMTGRDAFIAVVAVLALVQVHASWRLSYLQGDTPVDMLMYNQTSPDVTRMMAELSTLSDEVYGGNGLVIWYDSGTAWPMQWYLRDFPHRVFYNRPLDEPPSRDGVQADVLLVANNNIANVEEQMAGYTPQEYVLRWHFPEDTYRNFAIAPELDPGRSAWDNSEDPHGPGEILGSVVDSLETQFAPEGQQRVYRLVVYRDLPVPIRGYEFTVYVRNDLVPLLNTIRY